MDIILSYDSSILLRSDSIENVLLDFPSELCNIISQYSFTNQTIFKLKPYANNISLKIKGEYTIDWGDGTINDSNSHRYEYKFDDTEKTITISGNIKSFNGFSKNTILCDVVQLSDHIQNLDEAFSNIHSNFTINCSLPCNLTSTYKLFSNSNFNSPVNHFGMSNIVDSSYMFHNCNEFNQPLDQWDVSNIYNFNNMFYNCFNFNQPLNNWITHNMKSSVCMFYQCRSLDQPFNNWITSYLVDMADMFYDCHLLQNSFVSWNFSSVKNMTLSFFNCKNIKESDFVNCVFRPNVIKHNTFFHVVQNKEEESFFSKLSSLFSKSKPKSKYTIKYDDNDDNDNCFNDTSSPHDSSHDHSHDSSYNHSHDSSHDSSHDFSHDFSPSHDN